MDSFVEGRDVSQPTLPAMWPGKPSSPLRRRRRPGCSGRSGGSDSGGLLRRFVVAETSMLPALRPGDGLIAVRTRRIRRGEIRVFEHPQRPDFWLVKRVGHVRGLDFEAVSDDPTAGAVDSATFGDVPVEGSYRVIVRWPLRRRMASSPRP